MLKSFEARKCIDCGEDISNTHLSRLRCDECRKDKTRYKEPIVARECIICGELFTKPRGKYCSPECSRIALNIGQMILYNKSTKFIKKANKPKQLPKLSLERRNEINRMAREYNKKNFGKLMHEKNIEKLGTPSTMPIFRQNADNKITRKKDGTPDWEKERLYVNILKSKTFSKNKIMYSGTESDVIRGIYKKDVNGID